VLVEVIFGDKVVLTTNIPHAMMMSKSTAVREWIHRRQGGIVAAAANFDFQIM
jgi:hypothetical protein